MKYVKLFDTHSEYEMYINDEPILPNISFCKDVDDSHYNHLIDPRIVVKFNILDTSSPTNILYYSAVSLFSKIEIDDVELPNVTDTYIFNTTGEHIVKYTLVDQTTIGQSAFRSCTNITSVIIPNTVKIISTYSFYGCSSLTSVTISDRVTSIGNLAFFNCTGLTGTLTIPNRVTRIDNSAFAYCRGLTNITIGSSVTSIGNGVFAGCTGLTSIIIPNSVTSIGSDAFLNCTGLTSIVIPDSVTTISSGAFNGCTGLTSIVIPDSVTTISSGAFSSCSGLTNISVDPNNTAYDSRNNCNAIIETTTNKLIAGCKNTVIPNTVTSIGDSTFIGCSSLTSITIPDTVTSIGNNAFNGCKGLTNITIPDSVTSIGDSAFSGCNGLTSITIGTGVKTIGSNAFRTCSKLTSITSLATSAPRIQSNTFINIKTGGTLYVPSGSSYSTWMGTGNYYLGKYSWTKLNISNS